MIAIRTLSVAFLALLVAGSAVSQETVHVLKKGETLYGLARTYGVPYASIMAANRIDDANKVKVGQKILIPKESVLRHTVRKGETLFGIARKYDLTVSRLRALNGLTDKSVLKAGDVLAVGEKAPAAAAAAEKQPDQTLRWPVRPKDLSYLEGKLYGVVLTGEQDERVESLSSGTVVSAEAYRGFGRVAIVQSPDGHVYVYGGNESLSVKPGDRVASGAELGRLGVDSLTGKPSLFFFVYKDNVAVDPAKAPRS